MRRMRVRGPFSAVEQARQQIKTAQSATEMADAQYALNRALDRIDRLNRPAPSRIALLGQVASTSRFNLGGASPLVGRSLAALGLGKEAIGGFSIAAGGAAAAGVALHKLADFANEGGRALKQVRDSAIISGGTPRESALIRALGGTAAEAAALRERLATDPLAMSAGASLGVRASPAPFGSPNNARIWLKTLEGLRATTEGEVRLTRARMLGVEALLPLTYMSDKAWNSLRRTAEGLGDLEASMGNSGADFDASARRWEMAMERLKGSVFTALGPDMGRIADAYSDSLEKMSEGVVRNKDFFKEMMVGAVAAFLPLSKVTMNAEGAGNTAGSAAAQQYKATEANTRAIERQTQLMQGQTYGGGPRTASGIPPMYTGQAVQNNMQYGVPRWGIW